MKLSSAEFRRLCGDIEDTRHLKLDERCVRAMKQIEMSKFAEVAKHMRIGASRRDDPESRGTIHIRST